MIIIKTIILYFIQMTHSDDFHSTGTRLVGLQIIGLRTCKLIETVNYEIYSFFQEQHIGPTQQSIRLTVTDERFSDFSNIHCSTN